MRRSIAILLLALTLLAPPALALAGDEVVPNGVLRVGADPLALDHEIDIDVAVIDTGVDPTATDLNVVGGVDCTEQPSHGPLPEAMRFTVEGFPNSPLPLARPQAGMPDWADGFGHGTHVAGIIGAKADGGGVVGVAPGARIWSVRVLNSYGYGSLETVACGLDWVKKHADVIDVVNMSLGETRSKTVEASTARCVRDGGYPDLRLMFGGEVKTDPMRQLVCEVTDLGIPVVVAAGNSDNDIAYNAPAGYPEAIAVSNFADFDGKAGGEASWEDPCGLRVGGFDDQLWTHANNTVSRDYTTSYGAGVVVAAPGTCVLSTVPWGYAQFTGTSMAAPHVTGAVARYLERHPDATVAEVRKALIASGDPQPDNFHDVDGFPEPILNVERLVNS